MTTYRYSTSLICKDIIYLISLSKPCSAPQLRSGDPGPFPHLASIVPTQPRFTAVNISWLQPQVLQAGSSYISLILRPFAMSMRKKSLLIGINYTGSENELNGCHQDVENVAEFLSYRGYPDDPRSQVILRDDMEGMYYPSGHNMLVMSPLCS